MSDLSARYLEEAEGIVALVGRALSEGPEGIAPALAQALEGEGRRFPVLARMFGLSQSERCLLLGLIALQLEPGLEPALRARAGYGYVHEAAVRAAFGLDRMPIYTSDGGLNLWQLVRARDIGPGAPLAFEIDLAVIEWLAGRPGLEPALQQQLLRVSGPGEPDATARHAAEAIRDEAARGQGVICEFTGSGASDFAALAAEVAGALNMRLWRVQDGAEALAPEQILRLHRFATVQNAALFWQAPGPELLLPRLSPSAHLQFIANAEVEPARASPRHTHLVIEVPPPRPDLLRARLRERFPEAPDATIRHVAAMRGLDARLLQAPGITDIDTLARRALDRGTRALSAWATPLRTDVRFDDLVLNPPMHERLRGLVSEIRMQHAIWENREVARVYAQERALTILLQGPPGTGKTLSARVLAGEAGLPLFRVDVASLSSKWRGETAKNLRALFRAANRSGAILFVDEFEALASKRTEVRNEISRADNQDTAYFLQLIETAYEGVAIFATNRAMEVDEAMLRRIRHTLDFQIPGEAERRALWRLALAPFAPGDEVMAFADVLAPTFEFSGARIKAVVLNAVAIGAADGGAGLSLDALRRATMVEASQNGRLPARREMLRVLSFGNPGISGDDIAGTGS